MEKDEVQRLLIEYYKKGLADGAEIVRKAAPAPTTGHDHEYIPGDEATQRAYAYRKNNPGVTLKQAYSAVFHDDPKLAMDWQSDRR